MTNLQGFLTFIILIPIIIKGITLYLLDIIERKGDISIQNLCPIILNGNIYYLIKMGKIKELFFTYYENKCNTELVFYVIILILYFICLIFVCGTLSSNKFILIIHSPLRSRVDTVCFYNQVNFYSIYYFYLINLIDLSYTSLSYA